MKTTFKDIAPWIAMIAFACFVQYSILNPQPLTEGQIVFLMAFVAGATAVALGLAALQIIMSLLTILIRFDIWRMEEKENYGWLRPSSPAGPRLR